jgi:hypothetical protein
VVVDHWVQRIENPDASLFVYGVGNDAFEAHALPGLLGFVDSDDWPRSQRLQMMTCLKQGAHLKIRPVDAIVGYPDANEISTGLSQMKYLSCTCFSTVWAVAS